MPWSHISPEVRPRPIFGVYNRGAQGGQILKHSLRSLAATLAISMLAAKTAPAATPVEAEVLAVEEAYRLAKLHQDTTTLERILASPFNETNQNGNSRNKAE